jgi:hypothetical protein
MAHLEWHSGIDSRHCTLTLRSALTGLAVPGETPASSTVLEGQFLEAEWASNIDREHWTTMAWYGPGVIWAPAEERRELFDFRREPALEGVPVHLDMPPWTLNVLVSPSGTARHARFHATGWLMGSVTLEARYQRRGEKERWHRELVVPGSHILVQMLLDHPAIAADWIEESWAEVGIDYDAALRLGRSMRGGLNMQIMVKFGLGGGWHGCALLRGEFTSQQAKALVGTRLTVSMQDESLPRYGDGTDCRATPIMEVRELRDEDDCFATARRVAVWDEPPPGYCDEMGWTLEPIQP